MNNETYTVLVLSTCHLTELGRDLLTDKAFLPSHISNMILTRDTGFFIKLYEDMESNMQTFSGFNTEFLKILSYAHAQGYRMIEFDSDGPIVELFPKFDW